MCCGELFASGARDIVGWSPDPRYQRRASALAYDAQCVALSVSHGLHVPLRSEKDLHTNHTVAIVFVVAHHG